LPGSAAVTLCVEVKAPDAAAGEGLKKLVLDEIGHHPSHAAAAERCASRLYVELFEAGGSSYLTARIDRGVPARFAVKDGADLAEAVSKALRLVLGSDPVHLAEDITHYSAVQRAAHSVLVRGHNVLRVEAYEAAALWGGGAAFAPGGAAAISRGADHWQVFSRVYFGGLPGAVPPDGRILRIHAGGDAGAVYELDALSSWTFYAGAGAGVQVLQMEGRVDGGGLAARTDVGVAGFLRAGVRFLRVYDFDCDLFAAAHLPVFFAGDVDSRLPQAWAPTVTAGLGIGF
jgi:hypothetical protein